MRATEARITSIMAGLTLEQKVGQLIQADIGSISPADLKTYPLGSLLAGGNSGPVWRRARQRGRLGPDGARISRSWAVL